MRERFFVPMKRKNCLFLYAYFLSHFFIQPAYHHGDTGRSEKALWQLVLIRDGFTVVGHIVMVYAPKEEAAAHGVTGECGMSYVVHVGEIEVGIWHEFSNGSDVFVVHDEASFRNHFSSAGI